eukprot:746756-Hanusia_phi.AAC.12
MCFVLNVVKEFQFDDIKTGDFDPLVEIGSYRNLKKRTRTLGSSIFTKRLRLRGSGEDDRISVDARGGSDEVVEDLFEGLMETQGSHLFLGEAFRNGTESIKQQAVGYLSILMQEYRFFGRFTAKKLMSSISSS